MKTVVVVGNGPSLNETPLEELQDAGHTMIGVNRIHLLYPTRDWLPDHWVIMDRSLSSVTDADITLHLGKGYPCWVREDLCVHKGFYTHPRLRIVRMCTHIDLDHDSTDAWHFDDPDIPICMQGGSVPSAVQIAIRYLEAERIVAVGCDMGLKPNQDNHFIHGYIDTDFMTPHRAIMAEGNLKHAWTTALKECEYRGIELLNATIGGQLNVLPRIEVHSLT